MSMRIHIENDEGMHDQLVLVDDKKNQFSYLTNYVHKEKQENRNKR